MQRSTQRRTLEYIFGIFKQFLNIKLCGHYWNISKCFPYSVRIDFKIAPIKRHSTFYLCFSQQNMSKPMNEAGKDIVFYYIWIRIYIKYP